MRLRLKLIDYQEAKANWNRLPKSARYIHLGEAGQNTLTRRRDERDLIIKSSKEELDATVTELREMEVWPTAMFDGQSGRGNGVAPAAFAGIQQRLQMLEDKFQVFQKEYLKSKVDYRDVCVSTMEHSNGQVSEQEERDFFNRLEALEERVDEIGNAAIFQILQARESLEQKMEDFQQDLQLGLQIDAVVDGDKPTTLREKLGWFLNELHLLGTKLEENVISHTNLQNQISQLNEDNAKLKTQLEEVQCCLISIRTFIYFIICFQVQKYNQSLKISIDNNAKELQALSEAIKVLQLQASHRNNPLEKQNIDLMQHHITQDVVNLLKPSLDNLIAQLDLRMKTSQDETLNQLKSDFRPAIDFINVLHNNLAIVQQMKP